MVAAIFLWGSIGQKLGIVKALLGGAGGWTDRRGDMAEGAAHHNDNLGIGT